jgi:hypothetical protein
MLGDQEDANVWTGRQLQKGLLNGLGGSHCLMIIVIYARIVGVIGGSGVGAKRILVYDEPVASLVRVDVAQTGQ